MGKFELIATIIGSLFGSQALVAFISGLMDRKKTKAEAEETRASAKKEWADADSVTTKATLDLVSVLNTRIDKLEAIIVELRKEADDCKNANLALRSELLSLKLKVG